MLNVELLSKTLEYIKTHPQYWRQDLWFWVRDENGNVSNEKITVDVEEVNSCNTAMCFAGRAAMLAGFPAPPKNNNRAWEHEIDGNVVDVAEFATNSLGLTWEQADALFNSGNSLEDLETLVNAIIENPQIEEDELYALRDGDDDDYDSENDEVTCTCCTNYPQDDERQW